MYDGRVSDRKRYSRKGGRIAHVRPNNVTSIQRQAIAATA